MSKQEIRRAIRTALSVMSAEEKSRQSAEICGKLLKMKEFLKSQRVGVYLSLDREVNTNSLIEFCFANKKHVFCPKYCRKSLEMDFFELFSMQDLEQLPQTKWRIKQPEEVDNRQEALSGGGLDILVVPGVAFTSNGFRLGNGFGFYDKYLEKCLKKCRPLVVGLAFKQQMVDSIPVEKHDFILDFVLYP